MRLILFAAWTISVLLSPFLVVGWAVGALPATPAAMSVVSALIWWRFFR